MNIVLGIIYLIAIFGVLSWAKEVSESSISSKWFIALFLVLDAIRFGSLSFLEFVK